VGFGAGLRSDALDDTVRGVGFRRQDEKYVIVLVVKLAKGDEIPLETRLETSARAKHGSAWCIKPWIGPYTAAHIGQPLHALRDQIEAKQDLQAHQKIIEDGLIRNDKQADAFGFQGTPAFIVGFFRVPGVVEMKVFKQIIADARTAAKKRKT